MALKTIILAAGQGKRMRSALPKVLHRIGGKPLLLHVYELSRGIAGNDISIVYGHGGERLRTELSALQADWIEQKEQLGTGHAVMQVLPKIRDGDTVLILYGDVPLLTEESVTALLRCVGETSLGLLTVQLEAPAGYGRIVRGRNGAVLKIVEEKDAGDKEKEIREVNTGILALRARHLRAWLRELRNDNAQREYYLTDVAALAVADGVEIKTIAPGSVDEVLGVNDREQLAHLERVYQARRTKRLMQQGVTFFDPSRFDLRGELRVGGDVEIDINVIIEGRVWIGNGVRIGPHTLVKDSVIEDDVEILSHCVIEDAVIGPGSRIGPFARLRPGTAVSAEVHIGNFVEIKKSSVARGSKISHLSYIGDAEVGADVNIGAGTITCNYDGADKHRTIIEDGAFIGSDTQLVAPVRIGTNATIGAGSIIVKDAPKNTLTLSRSPQVSLGRWTRPAKKK